MTPSQMDSDTSAYRPYPYIRFIGKNDSATLTDREFFDIAGKIIFPVNQYALPKRDSMVMQLEKDVFPLIKKNNHELVRVMIRGAASPEGPTDNNKFLGEHRAQTLLDFINQNLGKPMDENFNMEVEVEDYRSLCFMMQRRGDKDYDFVQSLCDQYLPNNQIAKLKTALRNASHGHLWNRLLREYFPHLRATRFVLFFREAHRDTVIQNPMEEVLPPMIDTTMVQIEYEGPTDSIQLVVIPVEPLLQPTVQRIPRRELLSLKTNLLFDLAYMPGYNRWCPIPNVALEYYPLHGHFTYGASFDFPWWQHYNDHKYFQIRNYQVESRYYLRSGSIERNPPGKGPAFRGLYFQAYAHIGLFGICFNANHGWEGEGLGAGVGVGYVLPLSKKGHWRLEFGLQAGFFRCKYDPYIYESPFEEDPRDNLYYYKYYGDPNLFKKRQHRFTWLGPTRVGITLSYDLLYRRIAKKHGLSFRPWETVKE